MGKRQPFDGSKASAWDVLQSANAYYALSKLFTEDLRRINEGDGLNMHESVASATNRILALELYIKALLIAIPSPVPMEHDLVKLFNALPDVMREFFTKKFDEVSKLFPSEIRKRIESAFQLGDEYREIQVSPEFEVFEDSLQSLLERNRDGFRQSRYLFEIASHDAVAIYNYEYPRLALICSILCDTLESDLQCRPPSYQRNFIF